ncbi:pentatricopeptide repeat-containing protein At2g37320 [Magnolia sinica]|uniref:pentatricopeptide repeat-containing protein At2g37320 n=1 Tax=Magnolia sinica TaxID=86752 RepID=UPI0026583941|nr:pentatricopeptide repeat-containing protein At2g37320 [Magnolia sinica]
MKFLLFQLSFLRRPDRIISKSSPLIYQLAFVSSSPPSQSSNSKNKRKKTKEEKEWTNLDRSLQLLHLINPQPCIQRSENHLRLIQDCILELSRTDPNEERLKRSRNTVPGGRDALMLPKKDALYLFDEMLEDGKRVDAVSLSGVLSDFGALRDLDRGMQIHGFVIKGGFDEHVSVGSALVSLYCKCGILDNAYRVFENMPVRNTVSWTAIIAGFAQNWQVEACLQLFLQMKRSVLKPNDFTFASLLSVCAAGGSLSLGRTAHCQTVRMGFDSYVHVANSLISMYAKCGSMEEAFHVFESMPHKDLISWNSVITGYAQHGLAEQALRLLRDMESENISPDVITYLAILSSCRHAGLVEQGRHCFDSMLEHGVEPELDHYSCVVDLLGRAGLLEEAYEFIKKMPIRPNAIIWGSLLSSSTLHGNVPIGVQAAENGLLLEPGCAASHVQLANLYASAGWWNHVLEVRKQMKQKGLKPSPGYSWIEIGSEVYRFKAKDGSNTKVYEIFSVVDSLVSHMRCLGYVPGTNTSAHGEGILM